MGSARYTEQRVRDAVAGSRRLAEALRKLGLRAAGGNHETLRELIERHGISTDHLDPSWSKRYVHARTATPFHDNR